jgi:hypothetical protein
MSEDAEPVPVTGVAQAGQDRVRVVTGPTTHAGERLADINGLDLTKFLP